MSLRTPLTVLAATGVCLLAAACGGSGSTSPAHKEPVPLPAPVGATQAVSSANLAYLWPLTVDHGTIECRQGEQAVFVAPDGKPYALNDKATQAGIAAIEPLRATGSDSGKISLGALLSRTMGLCKAAN